MLYLYYKEIVKTKAKYIRCEVIPNICQILARGRIKLDCCKWGQAKTSPSGQRQ